MTVGKYRSREAHYRQLDINEAQRSAEDISVCWPVDGVQCKRWGASGME